MCFLRWEFQRCSPCLCQSVLFFKCVILCTFIATFWISFKSTLCFSLSLFLLPLTVCVLSIFGPSCQCPATICLRAAHLCSLHSYSSKQRCLCHSVPHQSDCSQLRQSPSVLLPLYWAKLTAGGQVRAASGPEYSEYDTKKPFSHKKPWKLILASILSWISQPVAHSLSPSLPVLPHLLHHHLLLTACVSVSCHSQVWLIAGIRPLYQLENHSSSQRATDGAVIFSQGVLSHK